MPSKEPSDVILKKEANADALPNQYTVSILYADTGKRKTTTACSMVNKRGLLLTTDNSWDVLLNPRHRSLLDRVKVVPLTGISQLDYIDFNGDEKGEFDTIIWDTVSESVDGYLDVLYDSAGWGGKFRDNIVIKASATPQQRKELLGTQILSPMDYRVTRDIMRPSFAKLFDLQKNLIFTSQVNEVTKGLSSDMTLRPAIPKATFKVLARRANLIGYMSPERNDIVIDFNERTSTFLGKSRIEGIEGKMSLDTFVAKYKEHVFK